MNKKRLFAIGGSIAAIVAVIAIVLVLGSKSNSEVTKIPAPDVDVTASTPAGEVAVTYPLTGLAAPDEAATLRRPLSVKIENTPEARPQQGINSADVVYETVTEGGITRFNCIFQSNIPAEVGSVRSGRNSDVTIVPQYDALFYFSGANAHVLNEVKAAGLANQSENAARELYYRVGFRTAPHNMFLRLGEAYNVAEQQGLAITVEKPHALEFKSLALPQEDLTTNVKAGISSTINSSIAAATADAAVTPAVSPAQHIRVPFSLSFVADWQWDANDNTYHRSMNGPSTDMLDGQPIKATNVVVLWASYINNNYKNTYNINMNAGGPASIFTEGKRIDGTYSSDGKTPPRFVAADGTSIKLTPGNTWFQVLNNGDSIEVS
ncbi:hypothetical protein FACS1894185_3910 [Betaproteobacteria bacterium]|nr:hypothetical protein FACS1894185_3910 [Betaproteobacteria bacterium]